MQQHDRVGALTDLAARAELLPLLVGQVVAGVAADQEDGRLPSCSAGRPPSGKASTFSTLGPRLQNGTAPPGRRASASSTHLTIPRRRSRRPPALTAGGGSDRAAGGARPAASAAAPPGGVGPARREAAPGSTRVWVGPLRCCQRGTPGARSVGGAGARGSIRTATRTRVCPPRAVRHPGGQGPEVGHSCRQDAYRAAGLSGSGSPPPLQSGPRVVLAGLARRHDDLEHRGEPARQRARRRDHEARRLHRGRGGAPAQRRSRP